RRLWGVFLIRRRPLVDAADLHRLERAGLPRPRRVRAARWADRHVAPLLRERPGLRRGPGCRLRATTGREWHVLVGERLAAVLLESDAELRRHQAYRDDQGLRGNRHLADRQTEEGGRR